MYRRMPVFALAAVLLPTCGRAQENELQPKEYRDASGKVAITLPADWKVKAITRRKGHTILSLYPKIPGIHDDDIRIWLEEATRVAYPLAQARLDLPGYRETLRSKTGRVSAHPVPHLTVDRDSDPLYVGYRQVVAYRRFRCRGIHAALHCRDSTLERIRKPFFAAVRSMRCSLPRWPELPDGYQHRILDGVSYRIRGPLDRKVIKPIHRCVRAVQRHFVRLHGRSPGAEDTPLLVIVHQDAKHHLDLDKGAANAWHGMFADAPAKRVLAVPYRRARSAAEGALAWELWEVLFMERYGILRPWWAVVGEAHLARMHILTGRKAPWVTSSWKQQNRVISHTLSRIEELRATRYQDYVRHAQAYALLFRAGPARYRRAYKRFLADCAGTADHEAAWRKHLAGLDGDQLLADVRRLLEEGIKVAGSR